MLGLESGDERFANLAPNLHHIHRARELMKILVKLLNTFAGVFLDRWRRTPRRGRRLTVQVFQRGCPAQKLTTGCNRDQLGSPWRLCFPYCGIGKLPLPATNGRERFPQRQIRNGCSLFNR